jgi:hypothetical protein
VPGKCSGYLMEPGDDGNSGSGTRTMERKGRPAARRSMRFLCFAVSVAAIAGSRVQAVEPATTPPPTWLADGTWMVQGRAIPSSQHCSDRLVRLTNRQGRLSGVVAFARASAPIQNLVLLPDGSFSGVTRAGLTGSKLGRFYKVSGKFVGDTVSLTLESDRCPPRHGFATRQAANG